MNLRNIVGLFLFTSMAYSGLAFAKKLEVDTAHSSVTFEATHLKISKIPGRFMEFSGSIDLDEKDITKSTVDFEVNVASINTAVKQRDDHLRSPDFFDAEKFPKAIFKQKSIKKSGSDYVLTGDLTIRGVTKNVTFHVKNLGKVDDPMMKTEKHVFSGTSKISRKDFGVNYGADAIVGDQVNLWINLETMPKAVEGK